MNFPNKIKEKLKEPRYKLLAVLLFFGVFMLLLWVLGGNGRKQRTLPSVIYTDPVNGSTRVPLSASLSIKFDRKVEIGLLDIRINPGVTLGTLLEEETLLVLKPNPAFSYNTLYTLTILDLETKKVLIRFSFTTIPPQGDAQALRQEKTQKSEYPLAPYTPPDGAHFYFEYTGPLTVKVYLRGGSERAKKEFFDWVKGLKIDISGHKIEWVTK